MLDNSFFLFRMVTSDGFCIEHNRFIAVLSQIPAFLAIKLALPLKSLLISYSVGYFLFHFVCYIICGVVLKNYKLGIGLLLTQTIMISHCFFWHLSEIQAGTSLLFPFFALVLNKEKPVAPAIRYPLLLLCAITLAFAHPVIAIPFFYIVAFFAFNRNAPISYKLLTGISIAFLAAAICQKLFFFNSHDSGGISNLQNFKRFFPNYIDLYSNKRLLINIRLLYYWLPLLSSLVIFIYVRQRRWLLMLFIISALLGYLLLINVSFPYYVAHDFYRENLYTVLCLILAFPIAYDVIPAIKNKMAVYTVFTLLLATSIYRVYDTRTVYKGRIDTYRGCIAETTGQKVIAPFTGRVQMPMMMDWASSYEIWILSTVEKDTTASIVFHEKPESLQWAIFERKEFLTKWGLFPYDSLNPVYFKFRDTNTRYVMHEYK